MSESILQGFYRQFLQLTPDRFQKWVSGYDMPGAELQDLQQRTHGIVYSEILDLTVARTPQNPYVIESPGVGVVIYGVNSANVYDATANSGSEQVEPSAFVAALINANRPENFFPLKHNRGFVGSFNKLYLSWPAQNLTKARLVVFKYDARPWINGESDNRFGPTVQGTSIVTHASNPVTTAEIIAVADSKRKVTTIYNAGANTLYVGDSSVTTTTGIAVVSGGILYWKNTAALYGVSTGCTLYSSTEY